MYNKNNLARNVLITAEEVTFHGPTKHTLDPRMIESSIIPAEERFIRPELGDALYEQLIAQKNVVVTAGNEAALETASGLQLEVGDILNAREQFTTQVYKDLWDQILWKLVAECVLVAAYPEGFVQMGSEGTLHNNPPAGLMVTSGFVTPLLSSMKWAIDRKVQDRVGPLIAAMHNFICKNISSFGTYYDRDCPDCKGVEAQRKWSGFALDIYEDDENDKCCSGGPVGPPGGSW